MVTIYIYLFGPVSVSNDKKSAKKKGGGGGLPEGSDLLDQRQVTDPDVDLVSDAVVFRVHGEHDFFGRFVENL